MLYQIEIFLRVFLSHSEKKNAGFTMLNPFTFCCDIGGLWFALAGISGNEDHDAILFASG
jgi:hypothetical protein